MSKEMKHGAISRELGTEISAGKYPPQSRLPSEAQLMARFKVSRPTVGRALRDLQGQDLIERRAGSGTYVKVRSASSVTKSTFQQLGLILTSVGKPEIFDIICGELANLARVHNYGLWWDGTSRFRTDTKLTTQDVEDLCEQFIEKGVAGVFFVPFEHTSDNMSASNRIIQQLHHAGIPVVLIDRDVGPFPHRNTLDLVGIDNFAGGYFLAEHLIKLGMRRIGCCSLPFSAPPVEGRIAGARAAMHEHDLQMPKAFVQTGDPSDPKFVRGFIKSQQLEAVMCTTDLVAAKFLQTLARINISVPREIRLVGFDDLRVASLLTVPLTTMHQPCRDIAVTAFNCLLERMSDPTLPPRAILLSPRLVVRHSCGAYLKARGAATSL